MPIMRIPLVSDFRTRDGGTLGRDPTLENFLVEKRGDKTFLTDRPKMALVVQNSPLGTGPSNSPYRFCGGTNFVAQDIWVYSTAPGTNTGTLYVDSSPLPGRVPIQDFYQFTTSIDNVHCFGVDTQYAIAITNSLSFTDVSTAVQGTIGPLYPGVAQLDSYFFVLTGENKLHNSPVNWDFVTPWSTLDYIVPSIEANIGGVLWRYKNYIVVISAWSIEFFYNAGNPSPGSPLARVESMFAPVGIAILYSIANVGDAVVWVSSSKAAGLAVSKLSSDGITTISTADVARFLRTIALTTGFNDAAGHSQTFATALSLEGFNYYYLTIVASTQIYILVYCLQLDLWSTWSFDTALATSVPNSASSYDASTRLLTVTTPSTAPTDTVNLAFINPVAWRGSYKVLGNPTPNSYIIKAPASVSGPPTSLGSTQVWVPSSSVSPVFFFPAPNLVFPPPNTNEKLAFTTFATRSGAYGGLLPITFSGWPTGLQYTDDIAASNVAPFIRLLRTDKLDFGTDKKKFMKSLSVISDIDQTTDGRVYIRWSDDDGATWSGWNVIDLNQTVNRIHRLGSFRKRTFEVCVMELANTIVTPRLEALEVEIEIGEH